MTKSTGTGGLRSYGISQKEIDLLVHTSIHGSAEKGKGKRMSDLNWTGEL